MIPNITHNSWYPDEWDDIITKPLSLEEAIVFTKRFCACAEKKRVELCGGVLYDLKYLRDMNSCN